MTQKEIHNQRLLAEANDKALHFLARRHFLKNCVTGLGGMAFSSLLAGCGNGSNTGLTSFFDSAHPLAPKSPHSLPPPNP